MKTVKFNVKTNYRHIDDSVYAELVKSLDKLKLTDYTKYQNEFVTRQHQFEIKDVEINEVVQVADWFYNSNKDTQIEINNSIINYKTADGLPCAFSIDDAQMHYNYNETTKKVFLFELVEDKKTK